MPSTIDVFELCNDDNKTLANSMRRCSLSVTTVTGIDINKSETMQMLQNSIVVIPNWIKTEQNIL